MLHEKEANIVPQTRFQLASMVRYLLLKGNSFFSISVYKHWKEKFFVEYNRFRYWQIWDIFLKVKWEKRRESTPHSLFHFTAVFIYMGRESKCENKCRFYYSFRLREIHTRNGDCGGEREKKGKKDSKGFGHDFSERFYDSLLVCQLSGDIDCYHGRVESRTWYIKTTKRWFIA